MMNAKSGSTITQYASALSYFVDKIQYRSGYKYQLADNYSVFVGILHHKIRTDYITLTPTGWLTIRKGYAWDGATGLPITPGTLMRASLVHDALYQLIRNGLFNNRAAADEVFFEFASEDGFMAAPLALWIVEQWGGEFARYYPDKLAVRVAP